MPVQNDVWQPVSLRERSERLGQRLPSAALAGSEDEEAAAAAVCCVLRLVGKRERERGYSVLIL
jgi:hypothetical protein